MKIMKTNNNEPHIFPGWKKILKNPEAKIFLLGLLSLSIILGWALCFPDSNTVRGGRIFKIFGVHLVSGRLGGLSMAKQYSFTDFQAIFLAFLIECTIVSIFFSIFSLSYRNYIRIPIFQKSLNSIQSSAEKHHPSMVRWGIPGLFVFVFFPFMMTGPVVGSVIGLLLGMDVWLVMSVVMAGTLTAIVIQTLLLKIMLKWASSFTGALPIIIISGLILILVIMRLKTFKQLLYDALSSRKEQQDSSPHKKEK